MFKRRKDMQADPQLKQIHPLGKSPVVTIQTPAMSKPLVLAESGAIVEYLIDSFGRDDTIQRCERFAPGCTPSVGAESESWLREHHYMHYVEGSLMPLHVVEAILSSQQLLFKLAVYRADKNTRHS